MITKDQHKKLISKFKGKVYQKVSPRVRERLSWEANMAPLLKNKRVLEIGCNAGIQAIEFSKHVEQYYGIEKKEIYYNQAIITKKEFKLKNVEFVRMAVEDFALTHNINAIVLSRVLYHLSQHEIEILIKANILLQCDIALIFCGSKPKGDRDHNNYKFHKPKNVAKFFKDVGMDFEINLVHDRYFAGVATRG